MLTTVVAVAADQKPVSVVRELTVKSASGIEGGNATMPTKITTAEELKKAVGESADAVAKDVNFEKEYLLVFKWRGSGQDALAASTEAGDKSTAVFAYTRGRTKDLREHFKVFAVAKGTEWKMAK
jgi:hypothetical protein